MCLDRLSDFKIPKPYVGWKYFDVRDYGVHVESHISCVKYSVFYKWMHEKDFRSWLSKEFMVSYASEIYLSGFHIYLQKEDAERYCYRNSVILPVRFRKVVARGYQYGLKIVVAKEIMIMVEEL